VIGRLAAAILIVWAIGFAAFSMALPGGVTLSPAIVKTDAVAVATGGAGRIERGLAVLESGSSAHLLVSGVDPEVKPDEFSAQFQVPARIMKCCITLGFAAVDTRGNAAEIAEWIGAHDYSSVRLVTTDWHMWRASAELRQTLPEGVIIVQDAVPSRPSLRILFLEYHKLIASRLSLVVRMIFP